jgi:ribosomal protein S18 acetylase RimI-like enzyme
VLKAGHAVFDNPPVVVETRAFLEGPGNDLIVALDGERILGFASGIEMRHPDKKPQYFVSEVGVDARFRRQGIALRLCRAILERARERGCTGGVWVATESENGPARALYRRLGARESEGIVVCDWGGVMDDGPNR